MLPVYDAGFISLDKQFLTIGINGMVEAAEFKGIKISDNEDYRNFINENLKVIYDCNREAKKEYGYMFNTEFVPAENLGIKNANWDKKDGLIVNRDCYNSYFYIVEDVSQNLIDKFTLHGHEYIKYLDGGSAYHCNLEEYATKEGFKKLLNVAASTGCNYFCFNIKVTICNDCDYINKETKQICIKCNSKNIDYATRVIGYLKRITNFSKDRQLEENKRYYGKSKV
jgi:ribonucleoside-triphosphate reductase